MQLSLLTELVRHDLRGRHRAAWLGSAWTFLNPILSVALYTLVFSGILQVRFSPAAEPPLHYAAELLIRFSTYLLISEILTFSPRLLTSHAHYVKKIVFPVHLIPVSKCAVKGMDFLVMLALALSLCAALGKQTDLSATALAAVLVSIFAACTGISLALAAIGAYLPDLGEALPFLSRLLLYVAPVFYPMDSVPDALRPWIWLNPLTWMVEPLQLAVFNGGDTGQTLALAAFSALTLGGGVAIFRTLRKGFSDVV